MHRVKLINITDSVQAVVIKQFDTEKDLPAVRVDFYTQNSDVDIYFGTTVGYKDDEKRDQVFNQITTESLSSLYNNVCKSMSFDELQIK